jgi:hypothetical protein
MKRTWLLAAVLLMGACVKPMTWVGVAPGTTVVREHLSVKVDAAWNHLEGGTPNPKHDVWTSDGSPLDHLHFFVGIAPGEALIELKNRPEKQVPKFQKTMQSYDIVELYETLSTLDGSTFTRGKLIPTTFAGGSGFRFEYTLVRKADEVIMSGVGFATVQKDQLYLMVFEAPRIHYFAKHLPRVEAIAASAQIIG